MRQANIMAIAAAIETVYGTDEVPTPSTGAIEAVGIAPQPYQGGTVQSDVVKPYLGNNKTIKTGEHSAISFSVELSGSGTADVPPEVGKLLRACGWSETVAVGTSVTYGLVASDDLNGSESVTLYAYLDGEVHKMPGCRGSAKLGFTSAGLPKIDFNFVGFYRRPEAIDFSTLTFDYSKFLDAVPVSKVNTPTFDVFTHASVMSSFDVDQGQSVSFRNQPNFEGAVITDRKVSGSLSIDAHDLATVNFYEQLESHNGVTTGAIDMVHGTVAGNIVEVHVAKAQLTDLSNSESDGILQYNLSFNALPNAGNDEMTIVFK